MMKRNFDLTNWWQGAADWLPPDTLPPQPKTRLERWTETAVDPYPTPDEVLALTEMPAVLARLGIGQRCLNSLT